MDSLDMRVTKRNGELKEMLFDKILTRIKKIGQEAYIQINYQQLVMKVIDALQVEITKDDIDMIDSYCALNKVQTRIFYLPYKLTSNSLMFDKDTMLEWQNLGKNKKFNIKKIGYKK